MLSDEETRDVLDATYRVEDGVGPVFVEASFERDAGFLRQVHSLDLDGSATALRRNVYRGRWLTVDSDDGVLEQVYASLTGSERMYRKSVVDHEGNQFVKTSISTHTKRWSVAASRSDHVPALLLTGLLSWQRKPAMAPPGHDKDERAGESAPSAPARPSRSRSRSPRPFDRLPEEEDAKLGKDRAQSRPSRHA